MKKIYDVIYIVLIVCCVIIMGYYFFTNSDRKKIVVRTDPKTKIEFTSKTELLFGEINEGEKQEFEYHIKNSGNNPLIIYDVITGCQCTKHEISKKITLPGDSTIIKLFYDSKNKHGFQSIRVQVMANIESQYQEIAFFGRIISKK